MEHTFLTKLLYSRRIKRLKMLYNLIHSESLLSNIIKCQCEAIWLRRRLLISHCFKRELGDILSELISLTREAVDDTRVKKSYLLDETIRVDRGVVVLPSEQTISV